MTRDGESLLPPHALAPLRGQEVTTSAAKFSSSSRQKKRKKNHRAGRAAPISSRVAQTSSSPLAPARSCSSSRRGTKHGGMVRSWGLDPHPNPGTPGLFGARSCQTGMNKFCEISTLDAIISYGLVKARI